MSRSSLSALEICAGAGGEALGLEMAGFEHVGLNEIDKDACSTLRLNRPSWNVIEDDIRNIDGRNFRGIELLAGGVPCPPFSIAGKQLGREDERDLFPEALRLIGEVKPPAVMLENVPGFASSKFEDYRTDLIEHLHRLGYQADWRIVNAAQQGVPQLRPRFILVALRSKHWSRFEWPVPQDYAPTVGRTVSDLISENGWVGAKTWVRRADGIAPTIVGGSKKHGGPDLGPTRAKRQWAALGVDGMGIADAAPSGDFPEIGNPRLTTRMVARIQGFPDSWQFSGKKTAAYRQVGNALPPPVAMAVGVAIMEALSGRRHIQMEESEAAAGIVP